MRLLSLSELYLPRDGSRKDGAVVFPLLTVPGVLIKQLEMTRSVDLSLVLQKATLSALFLQHLD